jgi:twitching motility two-component system response regulator PilH
MAIFDIFKRRAESETAGGERRVDERVRTTLGARLLVVDDSATIRAVLGKMLVQDGYEVLKAGDGEAAIEVARSQSPDLIFLDIVLPGMSGFAVLRALRRDPRTQMTPIVMMSGNQQATEQFYVQRFGADGFVKKPFGRREVFHAIRELVRAGRMPERPTPPMPPPGIPAGISPEEWAAIPEIAMPDAEHVVPGFVPPASRPPSPATVCIEPDASAASSGRTARARSAEQPPGIVIVGTATSMAIRPTLVADASGAPGPRISVSTDRPRNREAAARAIEAEAAMDRAGDDILD